MKKLVLVVTMLAVIVAGAAPQTAFAQQGAAEEKSEPELGADTQPAEEGDLSEKTKEMPEENQIVGGEDVVSDSKYPFVAALSYKSSVNPWCGGTLIDSNSVLTAAHCMYKEDGSPESAADLQVAVGQSDLSHYSVKEKLRDVSSIEIKSDYNSTTYDNDVAVLTLSSPVTGITPAVLPDTSDDSLEGPGMPLTVAGWGSKQAVKPGDENEIQEFQWRMQEADVPVVSDDAMVNQHPNYVYVPSRMIGAGTNSKDTCQGDSGGPLFANVGSEYVQVGITSHGPGCAAGYRGVYTEVNESGIHKFITSSAKNDDYKVVGKADDPCKKNPGVCDLKEDRVVVGKEDDPCKKNPRVCDLAPRK